MAELSVEHRIALTHLLDAVPDRMLRQLMLMVAGMSGDRARAFEVLLDEVTIDRRRRTRAFATLAPLFQTRADGVDAISFPAAVFGRLWRIASANQADMLPLLDDHDDRQATRVSAVCVRICQAAASAVRDQPDLVWPLRGGNPAERDAALTELAQCCDLGALMQRALPALPAWVGRPTDNQLAELRLLVRDSAEMAPDGARRLLDILFAHLADASLILRLVVHASDAARRESFLRESELAIFVERLLKAVEVRVARTRAFTPGQPLEGLKADLAWMAETLTELDATLNLQPDSVWGKQTHDARRLVSEKLTGILVGVDRAIDRVLPMERVQTAGRMTRAMPLLTAAIDPGARETAEGIIAVVGAVRTLAGAFGCEARRHDVTEALKLRLVDYADLALEEINAGDIPNEEIALARVTLAAKFLERIDAAQEARAVRRRVAVAGGPPVLNRASSTTG